jgi:hypothetical protein
LSESGGQEADDGSGIDARRCPAPGLGCPFRGDLVEAETLRNVVPKNVGGHVAGQDVPLKAAVALQGVGHVVEALAVTGGALALLFIEALEERRL